MNKRTLRRPVQQALKSDIDMHVHLIAVAIDLLSLTRAIVLKHGNALSA